MNLKGLLFAFIQCQPTILCEQLQKQCQGVSPGSAAARGKWVAPDLHADAEGQFPE